MWTSSELNDPLQECAGLSVTGVGLGAGFPSHGGSSSSPPLLWKPNYDIVPTLGQDCHWHTRTRSLTWGGVGRRTSGGLNSHVSCPEQQQVSSYGWNTVTLHADNWWSWKHC